MKKDSSKEALAIKIKKIEKAAPVVKQSKNSYITGGGK